VAGEVGQAEDQELIVKTRAMKEQRQRTRYALVSRMNPERQNGGSGVYQ
jgi:hypothetical protein